MSEQAAGTDLTGDPEYRAGVIDLLGVLALAELTAFENLAADAGLAPTLAEKAALAGMAAAEYHHFERLRDRLVELGAVRAWKAASGAANGCIASSPTAPADWMEGLVKAYIGDGIAADFYREVANQVDPATRELVLEVLEDSGPVRFVVERVRAAVEADPVLAGRLALWGRRLVGEALSQAQQVAVERDALSALIVGGVNRPGMDLAEIGRMFARLTENNTARMAELGLTR